MIFIYFWYFSPAIYPVPLFVILIYYIYFMDDISSKATISYSPADDGRRRDGHSSLYGPDGQNNIYMNTQQ